jgi:hypothetical protein
VDVGPLFEANYHRLAKRMLEFMILLDGELSALRVGFCFVLGPHDKDHVFARRVSSEMPLIEVS